MAVALLTACERHVVDEDVGNVHIRFMPTTADVTRTSTKPADFFSRLNVQMFDDAGEKVFASVKTQTSDDADFGFFTCELSPGSYTVVAVGHSSPRTATIKSPELVQFTAQDGEKLTDTFCYCGVLTVGENGATREVRMNRVCAMLRFRFTDTCQPESFTRLKIDYTGGSANFNPSTSEGCTKSSQSETRQAPADEYRCFTFPYMSNEGRLTVTLSALNDNGTVIRQRTLTDVPVKRNYISTYYGKFFEEGDGTFTLESFGLSVNGKWDGETEYGF